jgi:orotate phosphoribosyltransferase
VTDALALLRRRGAIRSGHFLLSSGRHSDTYVEKGRVFEDPAATTDLAREIASWYERIQAVVSPAVGALPLGFAVALAAESRVLYAEREDGRMTLRRGFLIHPGERVLVVEDVVTTGGSTIRAVETVRHAGLEVCGVLAVVDRLAGGAEAIVVAAGGAPYEALATIDEVYPDRPDRDGR